MLPHCPYCQMFVHTVGLLKHCRTKACQSARSSSSENETVANIQQVKEANSIVFYVDNVPLSTVT
jgi:hypothetical protein